MPPPIPDRVVGTFLQWDYRTAKLARASLNGCRKVKRAPRAFARAASRLDPPDDVTLADAYNLEGVARGVRWPPSEGLTPGRVLGSITSPQGN